MCSIRSDIKLLDSGILPPSFDYNLYTKTSKELTGFASEATLDYGKLDYVNYKTPDYYFNKLHLAIQRIPGTYEYCEAIADQGLTPLELILQRQIPFAYEV